MQYDAASETLSQMRVMHLSPDEARTPEGAGGIFMSEDTVRVEEAEISCAVAVMVVIPGMSAVVSPLSVMVATSVFDDDQTTDADRSFVVLSE